MKSSIKTSGLDLADEIKEVPTELDAIVENIQLLAENQEIAPLPQPWLPPLRERMTLDELEAVDFHKEWNKKPSDLELLSGWQIFRKHKSKSQSLSIYLRMEISSCMVVQGQGRRPSCKVQRWIWLESTVQRMSHFT